MILLSIWVGAALGASGGPDAFGYTFVDSNEPDGPVFAWTDIAASGTDLGLVDDSEASVPLPFTFFFYGQAYDSVSVGDGALLFGPLGAIDNRNGCVPADNSAGDDALILPLWDDLNPEESDGGGVFWQVLGSAPERRVVIQFERVPHYGGSTMFTFQAVLEEGSNAIELLYATAEGDDVFSGGASATVGIQASDEQGLGYACADPVLTDGLAIRFDAVCEDGDGDGAGPCDGDCDDADPGIGPFTPETDDGTDEDCDGLVDEDFVAVGDLVIDELMIDPAAVDDAHGEWFELHNTSDRAVDLHGWTLAGDEAALTIDQRLVIPAGGHAIFAAAAEPAQNGGLPLVDWRFDATILHLANSGGHLALSMGGITMDAVSWDPADQAVVEGRSRYLDPGFLDPGINDSPLPWCVTPAEPAYDYGGLGDHGTPGAANPAGLCCHDDDGDGWDVCEGDCDDDDPARFPGNPELEDLRDNDCDGLADEDWLAPGVVVVAEFLDEPTAVAQELGEWFEVENVGDRAVNLLGWRLTDEAGEGFDIDADLIVEPGERLLFAVEGDALLNGGLPAVDWVYPYELFPLRSYDDDDIQLVADEMVVDAVAYRNVAPWDSQPDRSHYLCPGTDDARWWGTTPDDEPFAYAPGLYGTPGGPNPSDVDGDGDGIGLCDGDCDDLDPAVGPGEVEVCDNGVDDDCDGLTDDEDPACVPEDSAPEDSGDGTEDTGQGEPEGCAGCASAPGRGAGWALAAWIFGAAAWQRRRRQR